VEPDTSKWTATDRFYVNGVATQLGYGSVVKGGTEIITPGKPMTIPGAVIGSQGPVSPNRAGQVTPMIEGTLTGDVAKAMLGQLGIVATPDIVRAMSSWIEQHTNSQGKLANNNPMGLRVTGAAPYAKKLAELGASPHAGAALHAGEIFRPRLQSGRIKRVTCRTHLKNDGVQLQRRRAIEQGDQFGLLLRHRQARLGRPARIPHRRNPCGAKLARRRRRNDFNGGRLFCRREQTRHQPEENRSGDGNHWTHSDFRMKRRGTVFGKGFF
jgi:hypothetical protein